MSEESANDYTKYLENRIEELENKISKENKKSAVSPIDLDWEANDNMVEFSVTFAYQWWTSDVNLEGKEV